MKGPYIFSYTQYVIPKGSARLDQRAPNDSVVQTCETRWRQKAACKSTEKVNHLMVTRPTCQGKMEMKSKVPC